MSYSDPKIIVDRSAEIYAQGANQLGQTMVGFVEKKYADEAARNEAWKKKVDASGLSQQQEKDKANIAIAEIAGGLPTNLSDTVMDDFIKVHILPHPTNKTILTFEDGEQAIYEGG